MVTDTFSEVLNIDPSLSQFILALAKQVGIPENFTLVDLRAHNEIEHDASLFRNDFALGNNFAVNWTLLNQLVSVAAADKDQVVDINNLAKFRALRQADSKARDPNFVFGPLQTQLAFGEGGLLTMTLSKKDERIPLSFLISFAGFEKLPIEFGWKRSETPITPPDILGFADRLLNLTNAIVV
ncbi:hypothetical protein HDV03_000393 [Kappamyces sp. JEL0829]|nr:hypothetical protein HDV03_000393 [Kappamyces sp. JEL0829]